MIYLKSCVQYYQNHITTLVFMNNFWTNITRYPRFFISSMIGLILIILAPLKNLFKIPKLRWFLILVNLVFVSGLYFIIRAMVGL